MTRGAGARADLVRAPSHPLVSAYGGVIAPIQSRSPVQQSIKQTAHPHPGCSCEVISPNLHQFRADADGLGVQEHGRAEYPIHSLSALQLRSSLHGILNPRIPSESNFREAPCNASFVPMFMGSAYKNKGVQNLLDAVGRYLPSPAEKPSHALDMDKDEEEVPAPEVGRSAFRVFWVVLKVFQILCDGVSYSSWCVQRRAESS